jgi:anti-sigma regulatory factor (Ser/Thr protein kinase)
MAVSVFQMAADKENIPSMVVKIKAKIARSGTACRDAIVAAAIETLENIISYSGTEEIIVEIKKTARKITLTITDYGVPFDPGSADTTEKGLGLLIARNMADDYGYRYEDGKNISTYEKYL